MQGRQTDAAAHADRPAIALDMGGIAQRAEENDGFAHVFHGEFMGARADGLENKGDRTLFGIGVRDCQGDSFGIFLIVLNDDELTGPTLPGHQGSEDFHSIYFLGQLSFRKYCMLAVHAVPFRGNDPLI